MTKELDYIADLERENRLLGERCNQLLKDKGDLTDKIADIKANCDLAIEGRDIKIKELELELTVEKDQHQEEINLHLHAEDYIKELEQENAGLTETLKTYNGCGDWDNDFHACRVYLQHEELQKYADQLTKAKEIIKDLMSFSVQLCDCRHTVDFEKTRERAEQFLKEIEK